MANVGDINFNVAIALTCCRQEHTPKDRLFSEAVPANNLFPIKNMKGQISHQYNFHFRCVYSSYHLEKILTQEQYHRILAGGVILLQWKDIVTTQLFDNATSPPTHLTHQRKVSTSHTSKNEDNLQWRWPLTSRSPAI